MSMKFNLEHNLYWACKYANIFPVKTNSTLALFLYFWVCACRSLIIRR